MMVLRVQLFLLLTKHASIDATIGHFTSVVPGGARYSSTKTCCGAVFTAQREMHAMCQAIGKMGADQ